MADRWLQAARSGTIPIGKGVSLQKAHPNLLLTLARRFDCQRGFGRTTELADLYAAEVERRGLNLYTRKNAELRYQGGSCCLCEKAAHYVVAEKGYCRRHRANAFAKRMVASANYNQHQQLASAYFKAVDVRRQEAYRHWQHCGRGRKRKA